MISYRELFALASTFHRRIAILAAGLGTACLIALAVHRMVFAHAGHGTEEVGEYDLDLPRTVSTETAKHIGLKTAEVGNQEIEEVVELSGIVKPLPDRHWAVVSRVAGRIVLISKQVGDEVKKGELLARIDSPEQARSLYEVRKIEVEFQKLVLEIERGKSEAERAGVEGDAAKARLTFAESEFKRAESLGGDGAVSQKEIAQRRVDFASAQTDLRQKQIQLALARQTTQGLQKQLDALRVSRESLLAMYNIEPGIDMGQPLTSVYEIRADADGVVVTRSAMQGNWVQAGQSFLEIADYSEVQIEGEIPESMLSQIRARKTEKVRLRTPADPQYLGEGKVRFIAPQLEPTKRTAHLIVDAKNASGVLRGEMWVDLAVVLRKNKSALVVPRSAEVVHGPMHFVFIESGGQYQKQDINPGLSDDRYVEVKDGLAPGDVVVIQGAYSLTQMRPKAKAKTKKDAATADNNKTENTGGEKK